MNLRRSKIKPLDLTNSKFGKLTALVRVENNRHGKAMWGCLCDCGNHSIVNTADLTSGKTTSCGCSRVKHGMSKTKFHSIWLSMRDRCNNSNCEFYYCYGGRGICYDKSWDVFENFYNDMYCSYEDGLSIERIDVCGNYCKENCKWIPLKLQARNTRKRKANTSGITGLYSTYINGKEHMKASMSIGEGKSIYKSMSVDKHTHEKCLKILCDWLEENRKIYGYGVNHGK